MLAYVANTGAPDVRPNSTYPQSDFAANGICHNLIDSPLAFDMKGPKVRYGSDVKDGSATTLMLSENIHKDDDDPLRSHHSSWLRSSAFLRGSVTGYGEQPFGMVWVYQANSPLSPAPATQERINRDVDDALTYADANQGARFARPASEHPEIVIAVFAGGNTKSISEQIEYRVYQQLMTPNGRNAQYPGLDSNGNRVMRNLFNIPPLSDSDY